MAALVPAGALVLLAAGAGWAYWHLNRNITGVDIDNALGDDRPARADATPSAGSPGSADFSAASLPSGALNILVLRPDSRSGTRNRELGGGSGDMGARSDTAMVVHLDAGRTSARGVGHPPSHPVTAR